MAGTLSLTIKGNISGLGKELAFGEEDVTMTVPVVYQDGYTITKDQVSKAVQLFDLVDHIALAKIYGVYIQAEVGTIYILENTTGTTSLTSATATQALLVGQHCWIAINAANNAGLVVDGTAATDAFSWVVCGKV